MDNIGSEVGQKMRSAIKAKLMELGCYVDDELPDYVMVMVANKRTRSQMEEDLQLFLNSNTEVFVNWLHQVLQKLQEVTVNTNLEQKKFQESKLKRKLSTDSSIPSKKERKEKKEPKTKMKSKKSKKTSKKKEKEKKIVKRKSKKDKSKESGSIRPNIPPLLMNLEKESSPSITDVFAGQILKTHAMKLGLVPSDGEEIIKVVAPARKALDRNRFSVMDSSTVAQSLDQIVEGNTFDILSLSEMEKTAEILKLPREEQIKEMNAIEAKIQGLKKKLAEQFESGSEDEDFLNIRTEAEELMGDFNEENVPLERTKDSLDAVGKSIHSAKTSQDIPVDSSQIILEPSKAERHPVRAPSPTRELPSIELNLPKRPMRDRLGIKERSNTITISTGSSVHRTVNMVNPLNMSELNDINSTAMEDRLKSHAEESSRRMSIKSRLSLRDESKEDFSSSAKRLSSRVLVAQEWSPPPSNAGAMGSIVRVPPRPRNTNINSSGASSLLMRAVADAHKSLVENPAKMNAPPVKKALVLPMRRAPTNIIIEVPRDKINTPPNLHDSNSELEIELDAESLGELDSDSEHKKLSEEYVPVSIGKPGKSASKSMRYVPTHIDEQKSENDNVIEDSTLVARILNRRKDSPSVESQKMPQFVVTLDGLDPNVFLNKKLETEENNSGSEPPILRNSKRNRRKSSESSTSNKVNIIRIIHEKDVRIHVDCKMNEQKPLEGKASECAIVKPQSALEEEVLSAKSADPKITGESLQQNEKKNAAETKSTLPKRRKASPIVFDVADKTKLETTSKTRERTSSGDDALTVTIGSTKYDDMPKAAEVHQQQPGALPPTPATCRMFPLCKFGVTCLFSHPPCKFGAICVRRDCIYSHATVAAVPDSLAAPKVSPVIASRVVPASNYKSISPLSMPAVCRFYPACANTSCPFFHPKACRYGKNCLNMLECSFYHHDQPSPSTPPPSALKWKSPFRT